MTDVADVNPTVTGTDMKSIKTPVQTKITRKLLKNYVT